MAELRMQEGNYENALKQYRAWAVMPGFEKDGFVNQQIQLCTEVLAAQNALVNALKNNKNVAEAIDYLLKIAKRFPVNNPIKADAVESVERRGDDLLKQGNYEKAVTVYLLALGISREKRIEFNMDRSHDQYVSVNKKTLPIYIDFKNKKIRSQNGPNTDSDIEYRTYWDKATRYFEMGQYVDALKYYNSCLTIPKYEQDKAAQDQLIVATKARDAAKKGTGFFNQKQWGEAVYEFKKVIAINPKDINVTKLLYSSYVLHGDWFVSKTFWTDAINTYKAALQLVYSDGLAKKIKDLERKIKQNGETFIEADSTKGSVIKKPLKGDSLNGPTAQKPIPSNLPKRPEVKWTNVVALELSGGLNYGLPTLKNQSGNIQSRGTLGPRFGGELVFLPNKTVSLVVGANYGISKFNSVRASSNTPLERFEIGHLQIPILLRLNTDIGNDGQLHLQGGVTLNKAMNFNYDNYQNNTSQNNKAVFNGNTLGFEVGAGLSMGIGQRSRMYLMLTYNRSNNLLDTNYKDEATNRSSTSMMLSGVGVKVIFRVF